MNYNDYNNRFERNILNRHLREARQLGLPATLTIQQWCEIISYFEAKCAYCQVKRFQVLEHVIPLSQSGGTTAENCVPACQSCNVRKAQGSLQADVERVQKLISGK